MRGAWSQAKVIHCVDVLMSCWCPLDRYRGQHRPALGGGQSLQHDGRAGIAALRSSEDTVLLKSFYSDILFGYQNNLVSNHFYSLK